MSEAPPPQETTPDKLPEEASGEPQQEQPKQKAYPNLNAGNPGAWAMLWKTPEERKAACKEYCEYLRQGRDKQWYKHNYKTVIQYYVDNYPEDFNADEIEDALHVGLAKLEATYMNAALGKVPGANAAMMIFLIKNKLKWRDRQDVTSDDEKMDSLGFGDKNKIIISRE